MAKITLLLYSNFLSRVEIQEAVEEHDDMEQGATSAAGYCKRLNFNSLFTSV